MEYSSHYHQQRHDDDYAKSIDKDSLPSFNGLELVDLISQDIAFVGASVIAEEDLRADRIRIILYVFILSLFPELQVDLIRKSIENGFKDSCVKIDVILEDLFSYEEHCKGYHDQQKVGY